MMHIRQGAAAWAPANVLSWDSWCLDRWNDLLSLGAENRLLLTPLQEQTLWREIIAAENKAGQRILETLASPQALAEEARRANSLLDIYRAVPAFDRSTGNQGVESFRRWRRAFVNSCNRNQLLPASALEEIIADALHRKLLALHDGEYLLVGFDLFTPAQEVLLQAIRSTGSTCTEAHASIEPTEPPQWHSYPSLRDEIQACALWAREQLKRNSASQIAVVLPNVDARRAEIDRIFRRVLAPQALDVTLGTPTLPYEFSLGAPLSRYPLTAAALGILRWCIEPIPLEDAAELLRSPWFNHKQEEEGRRLEFELDTLRQSASLLPEVSFDELLRLARRAGASGLFAGFETMRDTLTNTKSKRLSHTTWASLFHKALEQAGWTVNTKLGSAEYQLHERWKQLLDEFTRFDFLPASIQLKAAIETLQLMAEQTVFAPESNDAPVQVLGVLESAGSDFDAIWFAGASSVNWPTYGETHPLLPWQLQRDFHMPYADASVEYTRTLTMQNRILASASQVVFSHYSADQDGAQQVSPLRSEGNFSDVAHGQHEQPILTAYALPLETVDALGSLPPSENKLHGGMNVLKSQSLCPFRAFAEYRLRSTAPASVGFGMDARDSGNIIHRVLDKFWRMCATQSALKSLTETDRRVKLHAIASEELVKAIRPDSVWARKATELEAESLVQLLMDWLTVEAERPPFEVLATEKLIEDARVGPLEFRLRCDRIDSVDGGEVLIDYKTGNNTSKDWDGNRPNEPQLPLYAISRSQIEASPLKAIAFARIRPGECELDGVQDSTGILKNAVYNSDGSLALKNKSNKTVDLNQQVATWDVVLTNLANQFHNGVPSVDPKDGSETCKYCAQATLCRISELNPYSADNSDEEESESADE